jgi:hypothetical protein
VDCHLRYFRLGDEKDVGNEDRPSQSIDRAEQKSRILLISEIYKETSIFILKQFGFHFRLVYDGESYGKYWEC